MFNFSTLIYGHFDMFSCPLFEFFFILTNVCRTFDNVTYPYSMHNCWTLVSAHCSPVPSYAVFMRKSAKFATDLVPKMDVEVRQKYNKK